MSHSEKTGRNAPCPCGSGRKFKHCCDGTVQPGTRDAKRGADNPGRPCGDCSLCCEGWVKTRVLGHTIELGKPCPYSSGHNCTIHHERPEEPCRIFFCGWAEQNSRLPEWMRPDRCGVIVLTGRTTWRGLAVDILVSAGQDPAGRLLAWFKERSVRERRPFIFQQEEAWFGFGPPAFRTEIAARAARGEPLWS